MRKNPILLTVFVFAISFLTSCSVACVHSDIVTDQAVAATCLSHGLTEGSHCNACGKVIVAQEIIEPLGHEIELDAAVSATCVSDGKTAGAHCARCGEIVVAQETIAHKGHHIIVNEPVSPTCTEHGLTGGSHCEECGEVIVAQEIIEPLGHDYQIQEPILPTCTEEGKSYGLTCSRCNAVLIEPECTSKLPHQKGKFLGLTIDKVPDVHNPALFECSVCHGEYFDSISQEDINMPVLFIDGDLSGISKETKKKVVAAYSDEKQSFRLNATLKLQGATSLSYPKKNYNIQFFKDESYSAKQKVQFVESWGKQNKYTLKANWVDYSAMRNVVSAKIYGDIVHSRNIDDQINALTNGGAVDGFPILLYENGCYQGLYTLNTSKDDYLFGMKGGATAREALLMMNDWSKTGQLREHVPEEIGPSWELEYASTEDDEEIGVTWVSESFNAMMDFVNDNDGQTFIDGIGTYVNVPRTIDSMLYTWAMQAFDNISKNILWVTYDGTQWFSSVYDLDGTWGLAWDGVFHPNGTKAWIADWGNALWEKLFKNMHDEVIDRWRELRAGPLSIGNIDKRFVDFYMSIPGELYRSERMKWTEVPSQTTNHVTQIVNHAIESLANLDAALGVNTESLGAYKVSFECGEGASVRTYLTSDYSMDPNETTVTYSRNSDTGYLVSSDGQSNFEVVVPDGYAIDEIVVDGSYKNLKGPKDTGVENVYRITKIASDLTVSIKIVQA